MTKKKKVILHIGLPKTGTTALQHWCCQNRHNMRRAGVDYPEQVEALTPRHQFVVNEIRAGKFPIMKEVLARSDCDKVFLSTEGLSNQFQDFHEDQLSAFRSAVSGCALTVFVVRRHWPNWVRSYYNQCVLNPPVRGYPYATRLSCEEFSDLERVRFLGRLPENHALLASAFGADDVVTADYEGDWFHTLRRLLGCPDFDMPLSRRNDSLDAGMLSLIVEINRSAVTDAGRAILLTAIQRLSNSDSTILRSYADVPSTDADRASAHACVRDLTEKGALSASLAVQIETELGPP